MRQDGRERLVRARLEQPDHFLIAHLRKGLVELPHRIKHFRCAQAHHLIGIGFHFRQRIGRGTGTAQIIFFGDLARNACNAAIIVDPVASPSSTTMTMRPDGLCGGRIGV